MRRAPELVLPALTRALDAQMQITLGHITARRMTGRGPYPASEHKLGVRTGRLRQSLRASKAVVRGGNIEAGIGTNVKYAGLHEFGGTIAPHTITARLGKSLRFVIGGKVIFRKSVKHPGATYPERAPIYTGIEDRQNEIAAALSTAAIKALEGGGM